MNHTFLRPSRLALACTLAWPALALAAPGADSAYRTDKQSTHVEDATSKGVSQVNMITCFMASMRPDALVNKGNYIALVDENKCDPEVRAGSGNSGSNDSGSNAPSYMKAFVNATRDSNSEPMRVRAWIEEVEEDYSASIFVNISATEAPSASNPYGVFRIDYCGKGDEGPCGIQGYLQGSAGGIDYFEHEIDDDGMGAYTSALTLTTAGADGGSGMLQMTENSDSFAYTFAYNADYFRRSDGTQDQCFSRDASDPDTGASVWRYGLYDAASGERVNRSSGFPIEYTANGQVYNGHMGYWGLWLPPEASARIASGATVQRVQYQTDQPPLKTDYTLVKAEGRLMKYTKQSRTLASTDKIRFRTWIFNAAGFFDGAVPNRDYELYWDDAAGMFKVTGLVECGSNGCTTQTLAEEKPVAASYFADMGGVRGWSQTLGGELFIPLFGVTGAVNSTAINISYRVQDLVYPADMPGVLNCLRECPTAATIASYFADGSTALSPYVPSTYQNWQPTSVDAVVAYTTDSSSAMLRDAANLGVSFTDRNALQGRPQYQHGVRSGKLFTTADLASMKCLHDATKYCDQKVDELDVYYQWETGPNQWNQFAAVKDASGTIVTFDAPLQVSYGVPSGAQYGVYAGKSIVLQYGGFGELWGIPGHCVSRLTNEKVSCETEDARHVPAFVIPFDEVLGSVSNASAQMLVKWLDREIRFARKEVSECVAAGLALPSGLTLPTASGLADPSDPASPLYIGEKPVVADAPRVIHGDVKY